MNIRPPHALIPAALLLVAPMVRTANAQTTHHIRCVVESREFSTTIAAQPDEERAFSLFANFAPTNTLAPFVPETWCSVDGNLTHWNSEGYTGLTVFPTLVVARQMTLVGRTLQGSAVGQGQAVSIRVSNVNAVAIGQLEPGGWVDRYTCDLAVNIGPWPWHPGDANKDGVRNPGDIWYFTEQYMKAQPQADFDGDDAVTMQDLFDFLTAYFGA